MSQGKMATHLEGNRPIPQRNGILKNLKSTLKAAFSLSLTRQQLYDNIKRMAIVCQNNLFSALYNMSVY